MANGKSRPILISILAILEFLGGLIVLLAGIAIVAGIVTTADVPELASLGAVGGGALIVAGIIAIIIAGGFWNGWKIMWYLGIIFSILSLIFMIYSAVTSGDIVGVLVANVIEIIINLLILFYLTRQGVKEFFGVA
jgi:hypothetical protein